MNTLMVFVLKDSYTIQSLLTTINLLLKKK